MSQRTPDTIFPADPDAYGPAAYDALVRRADTRILAHAAALGLAEAEGRDFLDTVARDLAALPHVCCAFVGVLQDPTGSRVRTVSRYQQGRREDDVVYDVEETPSRHVVERNVCVLPAARSGFPHDRMLADECAQGFIGVPLLGRHGDVIGLIAVLSDDEMADTETALLAMLLLAGRASVELERLLADRIHRCRGAPARGAAGHAHR